MALEKVKIQWIKFTKDAKDIRREGLGKIIPKGKEMQCTGKALELFLKAGVAKEIPAPTKGELKTINETDK